MREAGLAVRRGEEQDRFKDPDGLTSEDCQDFGTFEKRARRRLEAVEAAGNGGCSSMAVRQHVEPPGKLQGLET